MYVSHEIVVWKNSRLWSRQSIVLTSIILMNLGNTGFLFTAITGTWGKISGTVMGARAVEEGNCSVCVYIGGSAESLELPSSSPSPALAGAPPAASSAPPGVPEPPEENDLACQLKTG